MVIGGCPYKENQKGHASETRPSTTPSQISTLAPTVTVNENISPPTITVGVNGKEATANLPSGASSGTWEGLNISSLPTDFKNDDILLIFACCYASNSVSNWTDEPARPTVYTSQNNEMGCAIITLKSTSESVTTPLVMGIGNHSISGINTLSLNSVDAWNAGTSSLITLRAYSFSGGGLRNADIPVTKANFTEYFSRIFRLKNS